MSRSTRKLFINLTPTSGTQFEAKKIFKKSFDLIFQEEKKGNRGKIVDTPVNIVVTFLFKGKCPSDIDNLLKSLFDALQGNMIVNDSQIKRVIAEIKEDSFVDAISVSINPHDGNSF